MSVPKPSELDLVPKYMSAEAFEFGKAYSELHDAVRAHYTNVESLAHLFVISKLEAKFGIAENEANDRFAEWVHGSIRYVSDKSTEMKN